MGRKAFLFASLVLLVCLVVSSTAGAAAGLVGWWKFDEGAGTLARDSYGLGNDGTLRGGTQWVPGIMGGAVQLTGSGYVVTVIEPAK